MMQILISIKPNYADKILNGKKHFEYRKTIFKKTDIKKVLIYATAPVGKIIGEFEIDQIISNSPNQVWEETKHYSGISEDFFNEYFKGRSVAHAIKIANVKAYKTPISLNELKEGLKAPQSFVYIN